MRNLYNVQYLEAEDDRRTFEQKFVPVDDLQSDDDNMLDMLAIIGGGHNKIIFVVKDDE